MGPPLPILGLHCLALLLVGCLADGITERATTSTYNLAVCPCDLTTGVCDINCCCDLSDCGLSNPEGVFSSCSAGSKRAVSWQCAEEFLIFSANTPSLTTLLMDGQTRLFCVQVDNGKLNYVALPPTATRVSGFPSFSMQASLQTPTTAAFYRAGDVILSVFSVTSVLGRFRQPGPSGTSGACNDYNPAVFLQSGQTSCTRSVTSSSCETANGLKASTFYADFFLLRIPSPSLASVQAMKVNIQPVSQWPQPVLIGDVCKNVTAQVSYILNFSAAGEIVSASVDVQLADVKISDSSMVQTFSVQYQPSTPAATSQVKLGLVPGEPVTGQFAGRANPILVPSGLPDGVCSLSSRRPLLFKENLLTSCLLNLVAQDCQQLNTQAYAFLRGSSTPEFVAMTRGAQMASDWTRVVVSDCAPQQGNQSCATGCWIPTSMSYQLLWAQRGLVSHPQNQITGVKVTFSCETLQCSSKPHLTVDVTFVETTVYPEAPRGRPTLDWKLPFDFFYPFRMAALTNQAAGLLRFGFGGMLTIVMSQVLL
ncbi:tectonic-3-like isoform X1 [Polypterus senegalus]|uniref:tectonic-3-like isoform X1 n=1 Tax=Polypterus senegalus TaxID=55291 RepID=UPI001963953C|nr:tectonic-3-like isoform X1 [Polypterus senegalus]